MTTSLADVMASAEADSNERGDTMMHEQLMPAFIAALMVEGVEAEQIERAVARVRSIRLGQSLSGHPLRRAFAFEQAKLLERVAGAATEPRP